MDNPDLALRRKCRRRHAEELSAGELNIVPYLDIVTNLLVFLLQASVLAAGVSELTVKPAPVDGTGPSSDEPVLFVVVGQDGFTLGSTGEGPAAKTHVPRLGNALDTRALSTAVVALKQRFPTAQRVGVIPEDSVPYQDVITTVDGLRTWFSDIQFAGF